MQSWTQVRLMKGAEQDDGIVYDIERIGFYTELKPRGGLSVGLYAQTGDNIDYDNNRLGEQIFLQPWVQWNVGRHLLVHVQSAFASMDTQQGEKIFDARVVDARLTWQFSVRSFLRFTWQHSATSRNPDVYIDDVDADSRNDGRQLLYSYKLNPQTVFFLGYSDQYVDDDDLIGLTVSDRSLFMKIGYAWIL
jgi:hypothetical protein